MQGERLYEPVVLTEAQSWLADYATETFCSSASTRVHADCKKAEVVGRRREDCTKQINNVMSPSHRNSILAALLLL